MANYKLPQFLAVAFLWVEYVDEFYLAEYC